jgi:hypothetical protein
MFATRLLNRNLSRNVVYASTRSISEFKKVAVVGLGLMGHGVAQG